MNDDEFESEDMRKMLVEHRKYFFVVMYNLQTSHGYSR